MPVTPSPSHARDQLSRHGFVMLERVFGEDAVQQWIGQLAAALADGAESSVLQSRGYTYGSRNLIDVFPAVGCLFHSQKLKRFVTAVLGADAGVVRALYFDKPPGRSWSIPWHRDQTIAVKCNDRPSEAFRKPTTKAGVPHFEAPQWLLEQMLTLRIHLDPMHEDNGPLCVLPGSHRTNDQKQEDPIALRAQAGDVLAMRPLLLHSSRKSSPQSTTHRRVIHIELARSDELPDGNEWYAFVPLIHR